MSARSERLWDLAQILGVLAFVTAFVARAIAIATTPNPLPPWTDPARSHRVLTPLPDYWPDAWR